MQSKKIVFIHPGNAYLPELEAYDAFFTSHDFTVDIFTKKDKINLSNYDVEWHLMGTDFSPKVAGRLKIHEYISLSLPPFPHFKNQVKYLFNCEPDLRIFHSLVVKQYFNFKDCIPFLFRDAGIGTQFFQIINPEKKYDFVYHGSMHRSRQINKLLAIFIKHFSKHTLLIVGSPTKTLLQQFGSAENIHFVGRFPYDEIPHIINQAHYGLNYIPPIYPYYLQPSLKLLEFCALQLKVISTDYPWVNQFEQERGAHFFKIKKDWSNFHPDLIRNFNYKTPDVSDLQWNSILKESNILNFIQQYFVKA